MVRPSAYQLKFLFRLRVQTLFPSLYLFFILLLCYSSHCFHWVTSQRPKYCNHGTESANISVQGDHIVFEKENVYFWKVIFNKTILDVVTPHNRNLLIHNELKDSRATIYHSVSQTVPDATSITATSFQTLERP